MAEKLINLTNKDRVIGKPETLGSSDQFVSFRGNHMVSPALARELETKALPRMIRPDFETAQAFVEQAGLNVETIDHLYDRGGHEQKEPEHRAFLDSDNGGQDRAYITLPFEIGTFYRLQHGSEDLNIKTQFHGIGHTSGLVMNWSLDSQNRLEQVLNSMLLDGHDTRLSAPVCQLPAVPWAVSSSDINTQTDGYVYSSNPESGWALQTEIPDLVANYIVEVESALASPDAEGIVTLPLAPWAAFHETMQEANGTELGSYVTNKDIVSKPMSQAEAMQLATAYMAKLKILVK